MASSSGDQNLVQHKIFLSHAGTEKDFVEQLYEELNDIYPGRIFFDKDARALPKGESFEDRILSAARKCEVAVIVMSENYFTRLWPMIELGTFVEAKRQCPKFKILPLFYKLSLEEFTNPMRQQKWFKIWVRMEMSSCMSCVSRQTWKDAMRSIYTRNGINYIREEGEKAYRDKIIRAICDMVPPVTEFDVSRVQGKDVIRTFFREVELLVLVVWLLCMVLRRICDLFVDRFFRWLMCSLRVRAYVRESCESPTSDLTPQEQEVSQLVATDPANLYDERMLESEVEGDWRDYFSNPREWWDNRRCKRNSGAPDFKHKRSGRTLWIDGCYTPAWVIPFLAEEIYGFRNVFFQKSIKVHQPLVVNNKS